MTAFFIMIGREIVKLSLFARFKHDNQMYIIKKFKNLRVFRVPPPPGPYIDWEEGRGREETKDGRNNRETRDGRELAPEYRDGPPSKRR